MSILGITIFSIIAVIGICLVIGIFIIEYETDKIVHESTKWICNFIKTGGWCKHESSKENKEEWDQHFKMLDKEYVIKEIIKYGRKKYETIKNNKG